MPSDRTDTMTAAELDALCAERLLPENRPPWWDRAAEKGGPTKQKRQRKRRYGAIRTLATREGRKK